MKYTRLSRQTFSFALASSLLFGIGAVQAQENCDPSLNEPLPNGRPAWTKGVDQLVWYNAGSLQYDPANAEGVAAFEARYGIDVKMVGIPESNYFTRATRVLATGGGNYDVMDMWGAFPMPAWPKNGWVIPVDCAVPKWLAQQWPKSLWKGSEWQGKHYFVPHIVLPYLLFWNREMFEEAGIDPSDPPDSPAELVSYAKKLTKDTNGDGNIDQWGLIFPAGKVERVPMATFAYFLGMYGKTLWDEDGSAGFNNEQGVKALRLMTNLVRKYNVSPISVINYNTASVTEVFSSGGAAMALFYMGQPMIKVMEQLGAKTVGGAPLPSAPGADSQYPTAVMGGGVYVMASSENPVAAKHLAAFMGTYQQSYREAALEYNIGANLNIWSSPVLTEPMYASFGHALPFADAAKYVLDHSYVPTHEKLLLALEVFEVGIDSALTGKRSPEEAIQYMVDELKNRGVIN